jgi:hypothetical protein
MIFDRVGIVHASAGHGDPLDADLPKGDVA